MENEKKSGDKYSKLAGNTLIFAISSFSSKLLTLIVQPFLTYAMAEISDLGLSKILSPVAYTHLDVYKRQAEGAVDIAQIEIGVLADEVVHAHVLPAEGVFIVKGLSLIHISGKERCPSGVCHGTHLAGA